MKIWQRITAVFSFFLINLLFLGSKAYGNGVDIKEVFGPAKQFGDISSLFNVLLPNILVIAGIIVLVLFIVGGFSYMMGGSGGDPQKAEKGKQAITAAVTGLFLIICAYFIMRIIEYITGINFLDPHPAHPGPPCTAPGIPPGCEPRM